MSFEDLVLALLCGSDFSAVTSHLRSLSFQHLYKGSWVSQHSPLSKSGSFKVYQVGFLKLAAPQRPIATLGQGLFKEMPRSHTYTDLHGALLQDPGVTYSGWP